jgi:nitrile hydratase
MHGFGPIVREENEPLFHAEWEGRVCAMDRLVLKRGYFTLDAHRLDIERMAPADYLRASYYERWLTSLVSILMAQGIFTGEELDARIGLVRRHPDAKPDPAAIAARPPAPSARSGPATRPTASRFAVGDAVSTRNIHPVGHTRLPRYARGKRGIIERLHGAQTFPDTNAHGLGEQAQPLYTVRFTADELWGESAEPSATVSLELWESYLEPASS